jgi:hypothetical protein
MANVRVNLCGPEDVPPLVTRLQLADGRRFLALDLGPDASIILPQYDMDAAVYAVGLANALTYAALEMERAVRGRAGDNGQGVA